MMAGADYRRCDVCDAKAFYDARLNWEWESESKTGLDNLGAWAVLCDDCEKTHEIVIKKKGAAGMSKSEKLVNLFIVFCFGSVAAFAIIGALLQ
jgi:hypothetical protein